MYGSNFEFAGFDRMNEFLAEAEKDALVNYAKQTNRPKISGLRQKLGLALMHLGRQLSGEVKLAA